MPTNRNETSSPFVHEHVMKPCIKCRKPFPTPDPIRRRICDDCNRKNCKIKHMDSVSGSPTNQGGKPEKHDT